MYLVFYVVTKSDPMTRPAVHACSNMHKHKFVSVHLSCTNGTLPMKRGTLARLSGMDQVDVSPGLGRVHG